MFKISFLPKHRVIYFDYTVTWCSLINCNWCVWLNIVYILALRIHCNNGVIAEIQSHQVYREISDHGELVITILMEKGHILTDFSVWAYSYWRVILPRCLATT